MEINDFCELLRTNKNLILTGPPGTGKTHLAKEIAAKMIEKEYSPDIDGSIFMKRCKMVQFHPSYDYTDLVEGLRPQPNEGFQRQDGAFKDFCKTAINESPYLFWTSRKKEYNYPSPSGSGSFRVTDISQDCEISFTARKGNVCQCSFADFQKIVKSDSRELRTAKKVLGIKPEDSDALSASALCGLYRQYLDVIPNDFPHIFIIDEINRGDLSKIFGELMFAIDPGYRGTRGRVSTQYQNLVEEDDVFAEGFYVPENVYIIGTMNDIDRNVDSIDFAIRRRFAWCDVSVEDRLCILDGLKEWKEEAKRRMDSLNKELISDDINLTSDYFIGPAYFLKLNAYNGDFEKLWNYHLKGVLTEYLRGRRDLKDALEILKKAYD